MEIIKGINNFPNTKRLRWLVGILLITTYLVPEFSYAEVDTSQKAAHSYTWSSIKARVKNELKAFYSYAGSKPVTVKPLMIRGVAATETVLPIYPGEEGDSKMMVDEGSDFMPGIVAFDSNKCGLNNTSGEGLAAVRVYGAEYSEHDDLPFVYMAPDQKNPCFDTGLNLIRATAQYWNAYYVLYSKYDGSSKANPRLKWITYPNADGKSEWTDYIHQDGLQDLPTDLNYSSDYKMVVGEDNVPIIVVATQSILCGTGSGRCVVAMRYSDKTNKYEKIVLRGSIKQGFLYAGLGLDAEGKKNTLYVMGLDMNDCPWIYKLSPGSDHFEQLGGFANNLGDVLHSWIHPNQVSNTKSNVFLQVAFKTHEQKALANGRNEVFFTSARTTSAWGGVDGIDIYKIDLDQDSHPVMKVARVIAEGAGGNFRSFMFKVDGADMPVMITEERPDQFKDTKVTTKLKFGGTNKYGIFSKILGYPIVNFALVNENGQYKNLPSLIAHALVMESPNKFVVEQLYTNNATQVIDNKKSTKNK